MTTASEMQVSGNRGAVAAPTPASRWSPPSTPNQGTDVAGLMRELTTRSSAIEEASSKLYRLTREYEGDYVQVVDADGVVIGEKWEPGPQLRWEIAVTEAAEEIAGEYEKDEKRIPGQERLRSKGELRARAKDPDLWMDFHRLGGEIDALQKWITARTKTLSARQSVLSAEKALVNG